MVVTYCPILRKMPNNEDCHYCGAFNFIDKICLHEDAIKPGEKVLIIDDVLATGGTAKATVDLIEKLGGAVVGLGFLINLKFLKGEKQLEGHKIYSLVEYV